MSEEYSEDDTDYAVAITTLRKLTQHEDPSIALRAAETLVHLIPSPERRMKAVS